MNCLPKVDILALLGLRNKSSAVKTVGGRLRSGSQTVKRRLSAILRSRRRSGSSVDKKTSEERNKKYQVPEEQFELVEKEPEVFIPTVLFVYTVLDIFITPIYKQPKLETESFEIIRESLLLCDKPWFEILESKRKKEAGALLNFLSFCSIIVLLYDLWYTLTIWNVLFIVLICLWSI
eukprot:snap_masked-scaffold_19-processed-gene-2.20-mRNA-1 protein AED:1.00 eAED:1.00 QI:0/0/0/0/1/1/2/0/177